MNKNRRYLVALLVLVGLMIGSSAGTNYQQVQAATWHKGAPKVLKGKWKTHRYKKGSHYLRTRIAVSSKGIYGAIDTYNKAGKMIWPGNGWGTNGKVHYRKLSRHRYQLITYIGGIVKRSNKIKYTIRLVKHKAYFSQTANNHPFYKIR